MDQSAVDQYYKYIVTAYECPIVGYIRQVDMMR